MLHRFVLFALSCLLLSGPGLADAQNPSMKMLFVGVDPTADAPGPLPADLPAIALDALPPASAAQQTVFAARLQASPVSSFVAAPGPDNSEFDQFFFVGKVGLTAEAEGHAVELAGETFALEEFADRVEALVAAFNPKHRRIALLQMVDPSDAFPMAITEVQGALNTLGFGMAVVMIVPEDGASCGTSESLHFSLMNGLADRAPFGDGDGVSTSAEVERYLTQALNRQTLRDPVCGPRYSVLLKSSNDPSQELVAVSGRSNFSDMETRLYNEVFEARFLLASDNKADVESYLANCHYCPIAEALTGRLRDMEEFARASALEAEIWERIQGDETTARLSIYLENCTLCSFRQEAEAQITVLEAKAAARAAEAETYQTAATARDLSVLREYTETCIACDHITEARGLVEEIEADEAYKAEIAALDIALEAEDVVLLKAYIDDCAICDGREQASSTLGRVARRMTLMEPCLAAAAVPQLGGPRRLAEIEQNAATRSCEAALAEFPETPEVQVTLGRIAQSNGDMAAAAKLYEAGVEAGLPAAYGLSAYLHYAPPENAEIDLEEAEQLAQIGAAQGDWLSKEILTVLYSKGLVPGRSAEEAYSIAKGMAHEGNPIAAYFLGQFYSSGLGIEADQLAARDWLIKAVEMGYAPAKPDLAELYEVAEIPDIEKAAELYWAALQSGDENAIEKLTGQIQSRNREVIRAIQQKLSDQGAYRGLIDGIAGPGTVTAIQNYANARRQG